MSLLCYDVVGIEKGGNGGNHGSDTANKSETPG